MYVLNHFFKSLYSLSFEILSIDFKLGDESYFATELRLMAKKTRFPKFHNH